VPLEGRSEKLQDAKRQRARKPVPTRLASEHRCRHDTVVAIPDEEGEGGRPAHDLRGYEPSPGRVGVEAIVARSGLAADRNRSAARVAEQILDPAGGPGLALHDLGEHAPGRAGDRGGEEAAARRGLGLERGVVRRPRREHDAIDPLRRTVESFVHDDSHELCEGRGPIRGAPDGGCVGWHQPLEREAEPPPIRCHSGERIALDPGPEPQVLRAAIPRAEQPRGGLAPYLTARSDQPLA